MRSIFFTVEHGFLSGNLLRITAAIWTGSLLFNIISSLLNPTANYLVLGIMSFTAVIISLVAIIPLLLLLNWGTYTPIYVKGQSIKKNIIFELLTDIIHLLSFFLRINIQLIRVVIFAGVSYTYSELYLELIYPYILTDFTQITSLALWLDLYTATTAICEGTAHLLFEIGHLWSIVGMQSGAFMLIVFIITQFLYTTYLLIRMQEYFFMHGNKLGRRQ